jgi:microcystin-dependent protein
LSRQANGTYLQPANTAAVSGQAISSTAYNTLITDIGTEITNSVDRGGRSAMTAALPMGNQKITGMADPTVATDGATKNYVDTTTAAFFSTGDVKLTIKTVADSGWVLFDDGTIGSASSGSSSRANADTQALFTLIFNNISDAYAPIFTSGGSATTRAGQTNAATAWAANCRISLTKTLGRALGIAGTGSGLTARTLGQTIGAETATLAQANLPNIAPTIDASTAVWNTLAATSNTTQSGASSSFNFINGLFNGGSTGAGVTNYSSKPGLVSGSITASSINGNVAQTSFSLMQPTTYLNAMIKL